MLLAHAMNVCEDDIVCDFAETYGILNLKGLPPVLVATLFLGLRDNSRSKMKLSGQKITLEESLLAISADHLAFLAWSKTESARENRNRPQSIFQALRGLEEEREYEVFDSLEDFEQARQKILGGK